MIGKMKPGSVIYVAVDQGGCVETIHPTYHQNPTYVVDGAIHYGVANMPGAVARTSTFALTNATLPYALEIANIGVPKVFRKTRSSSPGLVMFFNKGKLVCRPVESL